MNLKSRSVLWFQLCVILLLVAPFVAAAFRDNDQAAIISGSWYLAHHPRDFSGANFYNFDKQWGTFLALACLYRIMPAADPVLAGNVLLTLLAASAWLSLGWRTGRTRGVPLVLLLPFLLSPILVLYMPYLGTGWFSLAFLLWAFFFLGRRGWAGRTATLLCVAAAAACRADVILAIPALYISQVSRRRTIEMLRDPLLWVLSAAAIIPVLIGKSLMGVSIPDTNPFSFDLRVFVGFLLFGLTPAVLCVLVCHTGVFARVAARKKRFALFYLAVALSPLVSLTFYLGQLYTLRYLFLTVTTMLFVVSSRRSVWLYRKWKRGRRSPAGAVLATVTILPWLMGLSLPELRHPRITFTNPTRFPTGDGKFPMGGYLAFATQVRFRDDQAVDHNQRIWEAARSAHFETCPDGKVRLLITPMSNFLELAARLQGGDPLPIDYIGESPCGFAYVDARSVLRGIRPDVRDGDFFSYGMTFVSTVENGQSILRVDSRAGATPDTLLVKEIRDALGKRESELFRTLPSRIPINPAEHYLIYSEKHCMAESGFVQRSWITSYGVDFEDVKPTCRAPFAGWARTTLPPYMGL